LGEGLSATNDLAGTGILRNPQIEKKNRIPATSPKPRSCEKILWKMQEKKEILRNPVRNVFFYPKNKFLKTGICNLVE
ncbi:MAG: hypothetical protein ACKO6I_10225, partial [Sphingomonadales bacterium]